jgi:hypothetical protein
MWITEANGRILIAVRKKKNANKGSDSHERNLKISREKKTDANKLPYLTNETSKDHFCSKDPNSPYLKAGRKNRKTV